MGEGLLVGLIQSLVGTLQFLSGAPVQLGRCDGRIALDICSRLCRRRADQACEHCKAGVRCAAKSGSVHGDVPLVQMQAFNYPAAGNLEFPGVPEVSRSMNTQQNKADVFAALHQRPGCFIIPNPWDAGTAKMLTTLGFEALATTSAGVAFQLGKSDGVGEVTRAETLANAKQIVDATNLPVAADLENCFAHDADEAAKTITLAAGAGLVGGSIEDATGDAAQPIYAFDHAVARVKAAVAAAHALPFKFMLCARSENFLHGRPDLADTIRRLQAFEAAGADVLYAPGLADMAQISQVIAAINRPFNLLISSGNAHITQAEASAAGVKRISVGGAMARAALGGFLRGAEEMKAHGTFAYGREAAPFAKINNLIKGVKP
jgi:2-methylisocitrate lyase-like PEP mutase family enzyme